jgi:peroxiredoxin
VTPAPGPRFLIHGLVVLVLASAMTTVVPAPGIDADPFSDLDLIRVGRPGPAPDFTVPRLGAASVGLKELRGRLVFLNFWATWCLPCKEEMPAMERLYQRYKSRGLVVVGISVDRNGPAVEPFVKRLGLTFPIGLDPDMAVADRYRVRALPSTFLIGRNGNTVAVALGSREWDSKAAREVIEALLK